MRPAMYTHIMIGILLYALAADKCWAEFFRLDVNPTEILPSLTKTLTVNCSFDFGASSGVSILMALALAKSEIQHNQPPNPVELVSLTSFSSDHVRILSEIYNASVSGHVGTGDDAYLSLQWSYPSGVEAGLYQCEVRGMDDTGHIMVITKTAQIIANQPNLSELIDKIGDLQKESERQQAQYDQLKTSYTNLTNMVTSHQSIWKLSQGFHVSEIYDNHYYLLSKQKWNDASVVEGICEGFGGYLAEIDSSEENTFIIDFVDQFSGVFYVLLGGTDEASEGTWMFRYSNTPVVFTNWESGYPGQSTTDCMFINRFHSWKMDVDYCKRNSFVVSVRYLCEIPIR